MTVYDLNREQLNELKQSYLCQLVDTGDIDEIAYGDLIESENIPDEIIFDHYNGITFTEDDFFCSCDTNKDYKYYEVTFRSHANLSDTYSICIKAKRRPDLGEAEEFCKNDMKKMDYDYIEDVAEITKDEAYRFFDMNNESKWPVFE